jgi:hypothetical protein
VTNNSLNTKRGDKEEREMKEERGKQILEERPRKKIDEGGKVEIKSKK